MKKKPFVSVIVCTYNRKNLLKPCIESVFNQLYSKDNYEILIIDGRSTDGTEDIIKEMSKKSPCRYKLIKQIGCGLSNARNIGIKASTGDIVAFIDDDAEAEVDWLEYLVEPYSDINTGCVGGKALPKFESPPPNWFEKKLWGWVGLQDLGEVRKIIEKGKTQEYPVGCNISFRKSIFNQMGFFREDLGRIKKSLLSYEETEICNRILALDYKIIYEPKGIVQHFVPKYRISLKYFIQRYYFEGISEARVNTSVQKSIMNSLRIFIYPIKFLILMDIHWFFSIFFMIGFTLENIKRRKHNEDFIN